MHHSKNHLKTKKLFQAIIGITFLFLSTSTASSQVTDSTTILQPKKIEQEKHSPKKAALLSAALPGLGQLYNKKYWKMPVIYAGFGALTYSFIYNETKYQKYLTAYKFRIDNDPSTTDDYVGKYSDDNLNTLQKYYHRYRDLTVIGIGALYLLNIVDACVDAHLFTFNVDDDLTINIHPTIINTANTNHYTTGIGLSIKF